MAPAPDPGFHGPPPLFLTSTLLAEAGLPHLFSTRHLPGVRPFRDPAGPFEASALALFTSRGMGPAPVAFLRQVHGAEAIEADRGGLVGEADVVTTSRAALPLSIFSADCLPIIVYDPPGRRLAMAHAGWRGTVAGAARVAATRLVDAGGRPEAFLAAVGPSIGPCCYEVDAPVIDRLTAAFPETWRDWVTPCSPGKWMLDLWQANEDQLRGAGLDPRRIDNVRQCTACRRDLFHSYRRERGRGRLVAIAAIPDGPHGAC
jgi:YfiH family protein